MSHLPSDQALGAYLQALRTAAGLDVAVLARRMSLSPAQLAQLERGQDSLFYNRKIREQAARKVIAHLGGDPMRAAEQPQFPISQPTVDRDPELVPVAAHAAVAQEAPSTGASSRFFKAGVLLAVLLGGAAYVSGWISRGVVPQPNPVRAAAIESASPPEVPSPSSATPAEPAPSDPAGTSSAPPPAAQVTPVAVAAAPLPQPCAQPPGEALPVQPPQASKAGDMVHVVSLGDVWVCLTDASGKQQHRRLEAGQAQSFYGPPPWTVRSEQLRQTQLYFQGWKVRLPEQAQDSIQLVELR